MPEKVVVTGAAGLVGLNLLAELSQGSAAGRFEIVGIDKSHRNLEIAKGLFPHVAFVEADLAEPGDGPGGWAGHFAGAALVVQLHAQIGAPVIEPFTRNNVVATEHVLAAIKAHGVPYLVHASSSVVISVADDYYSNSKREQEAMVLASGIPCLVLRPTLMFGWFDKKNLGWLANIMRKVPVHPVPGRGRFFRQPLYVKDFCRVIVAGMTMRPTGETHDIAGVEKVDYIDLLKAMRRALKARTVFVLVPVPVFAFLLRVWAAISTRPAFTVQQLHALVAGDDFPVTDWPARFGVTPTPFAEAIGEAYGHPVYSKIEMEF